MICNGFSQNWWKVVSSGLLQYKPVCVINFEKLRRKMLESRSLVIFLYSYSSAHCHAWRHIRMRMLLFVLLLWFDIELFYQFFYYYNRSTYDQNVTTTAIGLQSTLNRLLGCLFLVHGQVTIIFLVYVCLFVCLFVQSFSQLSSTWFGSN